MKRTGRTATVVLVVLLSLCGVLGDARHPVTAAWNAPRIELPNKSDSVRFAVFGDMGTGSEAQRQVGELMAECRSAFPFQFVLMTGDNIYGQESEKDYVKKFERPYKALLEAGVKFYASLGNHDNTNQRYYKNFHMDGRDYYTFKEGKVRFYALNSNYMDRRQLEWLEKELAQGGTDWKICFFHHPPYSSGGMHGSDEELRKVLEPLFVKYGVNVVFNGHEHFYERLKPQQGVQYFISGAGGKLREGNVKPSNWSAKSFDRDQHFMLVEINGDQMHFQVISRGSQTVDAGIVPRIQANAKGAAAK